MQEAADLRPMLVSEITAATDLFLRDRARKSYALLAASAQPRLPFVGSLPAPPPPPAYLPGRGFLPLQQFVDTLFPALSESEGIQLETQVGLAANILGTEPDALDFNFDAVRALLLNPSAQLRELQDTFMRLSGNAADLSVVRATSLQVANNVVDALALRAGVPRETLFPALPAVLRAEEQWFDSNVASQLPEAERRQVLAAAQRPQAAASGAQAQAGTQGPAANDAEPALVPDARAGSGAIGQQQGVKQNGAALAPSSAANGANRFGAVGAAQRASNGSSGEGRIRQGTGAPQVASIRASNGTREGGQSGSDASSSSGSESDSSWSGGEASGDEQPRKIRKPIKMMKLELPAEPRLRSGTTKVRGLGRGVEFSSDTDGDAR